jgi:hypothetical protein
VEGDPGGIAEIILTACTFPKEDKAMTDALAKTAENSFE